MARKLLLADDSLTIQKVVELVMTPEDFKIKLFNDGEQALQAIESFAPDIVLADIDMPKLNGYQLCEKIKNNMATAHIPVILLAGAFEPFDEEYAKAVYADDYIIKPFESKELISKVKALLSAPAASESYATKESYAYKAKAADATKEEVFPVLPEISEEPRWDEDIPVTINEEEKIEAMDLDEEYEARAALSGGIKDFEDVLSEALKEGPGPEQITEQRGHQKVEDFLGHTRGHQKVEDFLGHAIAQEVRAIHLPSKDEITDILKNTIEEKVSALINTDVLPQISSAIENSAERMVSDITSGIVGNVSGNITKNIMETMRAEIKSAVSRIVPEVAEKIIKEEIEKITSELK